MKNYLLLSSSFDNFLRDLRRPFNRANQNSKIVQISPLDNEFVKIFAAFKEVKEALEVVSKIPVFIDSTNFIDPHDGYLTLRYHCDGLLNESYILKERMIALIDLLIKHYKNQKQALEEIEEIRENVFELMKNILEARRIHTHKRRVGLRILPDLEMFYMFELSGNDETDIKIVEKKQKEVKEFASKIIKSIESIVDLYCKQITPYLLTKDGQICVPKRKVA